MRRVGTISFFIVIVVAVMGLVYAGSGPTAWATANQSPQAQTVPTPVPGGAVASVTASGGGSATSADGNVSVSAPSGAVVGRVELAVTPKTVTEAPPAKAGTTVVGAFVIQAFVEGAAQPSYNFTQPVSVCTKITQAQLDAVKGDLNKVVIMRYSEDLQAWSELPTNVDLVAMTACATTRSLSTFALVIKAQVVVATPTPAPTATPKLPAGDIYLSGPSGWWLGLAVLGLFLVLFGGLALRRTTKRNS